MFKTKFQVKNIIIHYPLLLFIYLDLHHKNWRVIIIKVDYLKSIFINNCMSCLQRDCLQKVNWRKSAVKIQFTLKWLYRKLDSIAGPLKAPLEIYQRLEGRNRKGKNVIITICPRAGSWALKRLQWYLMLVILVQLSEKGYFITEKTQMELNVDGCNAIQILFKWLRLPVFNTIHNISNV